MVRLSLLLLARHGEAKSLAAALRSVMAEALGHHACLECHLTADLTNPDALRYTEQWSSDQDFREQVASPRFGRLIGIVEAACKPPRLTVEFISHTQGLEYVERVRQDTP